VKDVMPKPPDSNLLSRQQTLLGPTLVLRGELQGSEDLAIEGQFEGTIDLHDHCLTVGLHGQVKAEIQASRAIIHGSVTGNITAGERIEIRKTGRVMGDLVSPGIAIEDGAYFKGSIEILREESKKAAPIHSSFSVQESGLDSGGEDDE
jgi:cytoskeletal protein CcmA (bactofilin family)